MHWSAHLPSPEGDPIPSLQETYAADRRADKINLSIGLYYDRHGQVPELASVRTAPCCGTLFRHDASARLKEDRLPDYPGAQIDWTFRLQE